MDLYFDIIACVAGLLFGSFLNVVIYRLPRGLSIVRPRSACPACGRPIRWYENVPLVSWLVLRARCGGCGAPISPRYPVVEAIGGALAVVAVRRYGVTFDACIAYAFLMALAAITFIDWEHRIIPDEISLSFIFVGLAWSFLRRDVTPVNALLGALVGGGGLYLAGAVYRLLRHSEGMGGGDVKLMAMVGAFTGWKLVLLVILLASFAGSIYGVSLMRRGAGGRTAVAFGSFLAPAAAVSLLWGERLLSWYLSAF